MTIIIALLIFSLIIIIHELGHFLLAKFNKVTVVEFALGMGPRLVSFTRGETTYCIKLLPFGGSCMMLGEDMGTMEEGSFGSKSVWARISVIAAGPIFNFILAFLLSLFIVGSIGYDAPIIVSVQEGSPAAEAGIQAGDEILKINGMNIHVSREITNYVSFHQGESEVIVWEHEGERQQAEITPALQENGQYLFGISVNSNLRVKGSAWDTIRYSAYEVKYWIWTTIESLKMLVQGQVGLDDMSGPVGVVDAIGETYEASKEDGAFYVWLNMLNISILLTANLGVMNLLPLPALDGGRLIFLFIEAIRRKRMDPEKEGMVHFIGLMALMVLMVVVMFNDVKKLF
ncbi:MAG TPA: RIP metalloprotease RseP [Candidatus Limivivens intestinipullorum]|uniref:Zinc metalloprotease n=1 Tax=Candidatus Limivivens intestinipullorum TaxID=2840858 RepID=A0A9D1EVT7_9FIRM|nr:RIP metalloprotease RseP [Candidatus Limivivens intestinipullorum]